MAEIKVVSENWLDAQGIRDLVWSGAKDRVEDLTDEQIDTIISILAEEYPDGIDETALNDFLWFEDDTYAEWLGYKSAEDLWSGEDEEYYELNQYVRIDRADLTDISKDEAIADYLDRNFEYGKDFEYVDDEHEDWDDDTETYSGYAEVEVSEAGKDHLTDAGVKFTFLY